MSITITVSGQSIPPSTTSSTSSTSSSSTTTTTTTGPSTTGTPKPSTTSGSASTTSTPTTTGTPSTTTGGGGSGCTATVLTAITGSWDSGGVKYNQFNVTIVNVGATAIPSNVQITIDPLYVSSIWGVDKAGTGVYSLPDYQKTSSFLPGKVYSFGLISTLDKIIVGTNCKSGSPVAITATTTGQSSSSGVSSSSTVSTGNQQQCKGTFTQRVVNTWTGPSGPNSVVEVDVTNTGTGSICSVSLTIEDAEQAWGVLCNEPGEFTITGLSLGPGNKYQFGYIVHDSNVAVISDQLFTCS
ncbi:hypothetical protein SAMD00019534_076440 [Acytostelium subglobosum LB1]|uniref:hypothetical protein n=1 Tax=Acytostelium subglobosum LB1 TaxID=1410327 RepID=UPI000645179D|nr:hypothetical protein SAMD00019534_076440 [Acytostelium subglobosum LB1]GAM24469.1 hypothetical protein SAMD00019534_076440 [Acytostelium subglobosum LB1]|eukprot:XP_012752795.1 hypothetical protein SAMD00019534_076440 [Acytostelium subglobosum LB1]